MSDDGCSSYLLSIQRTAREKKGPHDQGNRPVFAVMSSESDVMTHAGHLTYQSDLIGGAKILS